MATPFVIPSGRMLRDASWLFDKKLEARDNEFLARKDRESEIEKSITRADLLEEVTESFTPAQDEEFVFAVARGHDCDLHLIHALLLQAKQAIVKRRLAEPAPRFSMTYCSQCGKALGAGNGGTSHCDQHGA